MKIITVTDSEIVEILRYKYEVKIYEDKYDVVFEKYSNETTMKRFSATVNKKDLEINPNLGKKKGTVIGNIFITIGILEFFAAFALITSTSI